MLPSVSLQQNRCSFGRQTYGMPGQAGGEDRDVTKAGYAAGAVCAGGTAAGKVRFGYFGNANRVGSVIGGTAKTAEAVVKPVQQSKSLWNALKLNYHNFKTGIANWAKASKMPNFMKAMFTGKFGKAIGCVAAVFVFISGTGEVCRTLAGNLSKVAVSAGNK